MKEILRKMKYIMQGRVFYTPDIKIDKKWMGSKYGGFYVYLNNLSSNAVVYSVGIGTDVSFDLDMIEKLNCKIYAFDPTPKSIEWVRNNVTESKFIMNSYGIFNKNGLYHFNLPLNLEHVSASLKSIKTVTPKKRIKVYFKTIEEAMEEYKYRLGLMC